MLRARRLPSCRELLDAYRVQRRHAGSRFTAALNLLRTPAYWLRVDVLIAGKNPVLAALLAQRLSARNQRVLVCLESAADWWDYPRMLSGLHAPVLEKRGLRLFDFNHPEMVGLIEGSLSTYEPTFKQALVQPHFARSQVASVAHRFYLQALTSALTACKLRLTNTRLPLLVRYEKLVLVSETQDGAAVSPTAHGARFSDETVLRLGTARELSHTTADLSDLAKDDLERCFHE